MVQQSEKKSKLLIIGAGHLVRPMLPELARNFNVWATTSGRGNQPLPESVNALTLHLPPSGPVELPVCDFLLISVPPGLRKDPHAPSPLDSLVEIATGLKPRRVVFISSLSVYGEQQDCHEETHPRPKTLSGQRLLQTEADLRTLLGDKLTILRPAGLIDHDRHPGKYLAGRELADAFERIHLIHEDDVREVVLAVLKSLDPAPAIINLVHPSTQSKLEFYQCYCLKQGLPLPRAAPQATGGKRSIHSKVLKEFMPQFTFSDLDL